MLGVCVVTTLSGWPETAPPRDLTAMTTPSGKKPSPCPFCGVLPLHGEPAGIGDLYVRHVVNGCPLSGPYVGEGLFTLEAWNRRADFPSSSGEPRGIPDGLAATLRDCVAGWRQARKLRASLYHDGDDRSGGYGDALEAVADELEAVLANPSPETAALPERKEGIPGEVVELRAENERLQALLNTPETEDFDKAVPLEAAHQVIRWGAPHDIGKNPEDWFWLVGYLAGKALAAFKAGDPVKAKHHCISTAAALRNWHSHLRLGTSVMRPGIEPPVEVA